MTINALELCNACDSAPAVTTAGYCADCHDCQGPACVPASRVGCRECGRIFDLTDETDAAEWAFGHDCEG